MNEVQRKYLKSGNELITQRSNLAGAKECLKIRWDVKLKVKSH